MPPTTRLRVRTTPLADDRRLLDLVPDVDDPLAWVTDDEGFVAWGTAVRLPVSTGPQRFATADAKVRELADSASVDDAVNRRGTGLLAVASFTFDADTPGSVLTVPRVIVGRDHGATWLTRIDPPDAPDAPGPRVGAVRPVARDRPRYAGASTPDVHWLEAVASAIARIRTGALDKVVLARDYALWSRERFDAVDVARRLSARFPACHTFVVDGLVGATPETLIRRTGRMVESRVLAGTAARDPDATSDDALGSALLASDKDRREHAFAVASVVDRLREVCADLETPAMPSLLRLANVQHLATTVTGQLDDDVSVLALAGALHPTAAVGGTPREAAIALIAELEGMDRQRYAAPVGWIDPTGDGELGIALRCTHLEGARARLFAGVGIVDGSRPEAELAETRLKLLAMQRVLDPTDDRGPGGRVSPATGGR